LIDSHCHLDRCREDPATLIEEARSAGLTRLLTVGLDEEGNRRQIALVSEFPEVFAAVGRHPNDADGFDRQAAEAIADAAREPGVVAIGETGLDFYRDSAEPDSQREAFSAQIAIAVEAGLPLVIHLRDREGEDRAVAEAFETLDREGSGLTVILHCFSAPAWVERAVEREWICSFAGNVTYPANEALREAAEKIPDHLIMVETDSPYLTPQPMRRERNRPALVVETARVVAEVRGSTTEAFDRLVTANAERVFGW
jgi:TatD DNase family protein